MLPTIANPPAQDPERAALLDRLRRLERASRPLEPEPAAASGCATRRWPPPSASSGRSKPSRPTRRPRTRASGCSTRRSRSTAFRSSAAIALLEQDVVRPGGKPRLGRPPGLHPRRRAVPLRPRRLPGGRQQQVRGHLLHRARRRADGEHAGALGGRPGGLSGGGRRQHRVGRQHRDADRHRHRARRPRARGRPTTPRRSSTSPARRTTASRRRCASPGWPRRRCAGCRWTRASGCGPTRWRQAIAADRRQGSGPGWSIAAAGTTDTGAVDPLDAIATIAEAGAMLVPRGRGLRRLLPADRARPRHARGIERSDSVVLDPAQGPVPALRRRHGGGARRRPARGHARLPGRLHAGRGRASPARSRRRTCRPSCRSTSARSGCGCR